MCNKPNQPTINPTIKQGSKKFICMIFWLFCFLYLNWWWWSKWQHKNSSEDLWWVCKENHDYHPGMLAKIIKSWFKCNLFLVVRKVSNCVLPIFMRLSSLKCIGKFVKTVKWHKLELCGPNGFHVSEIVSFGWDKLLIYFGSEIILTTFLRFISWPLHCKNLKL